MTDAWRGAEPAPGWRCKRLRCPGWRMLCAPTTADCPLGEDGGSPRLMGDGSGDQNRGYDGCVPAQVSARRERKGTA